MTERLKYDNYEQYAKMVEYEVRNKKNKWEFENWINRLSAGLNDTYHPNDLMELFVLATDPKIKFPKNSKKYLITLAMDKLTDWVVQHPLIDRNFTRVCMHYVIKHPTLDSNTASRLIQILDIMGTEKEDNSWLNLISSRIGNWDLENKEKVKDVILRLINKNKKQEILKTIRCLKAIENKAIKKEVLNVSDLIRLTEERMGDNSSFFKSPKNNKGCKRHGCINNNAV